MKKFYPIIFLILVISFFRANLSWTTAPMARQGIELIPRSLSLYLRDHLPDLEILPKEHALKDVLKYFAEEKIKQPSPFVCSGDFNGDGLKDFALLLRHKINRTLKLLAFHQTTEQTYIHFVVEDLSGMKVEEGKKVDLYLVCERPGKKRDIEGPTINLKNNSITLGNFERASSLYYFEDNRYKQIITGD